MCVKPTSHDMAQRSADSESVDVHHEDLFVDAQRLDKTMHIVQRLLLSCLLFRDMTRLLCRRCYTCKFPSENFGESSQGPSSVHLCTEWIRVERSDVLHKQVLPDGRHVGSKFAKGWRQKR